MKKILAIIAALTMCMTFATTAMAADDPVTLTGMKEASVEKDDWTEAGAKVGSKDTAKDAFDETHDLTTDNKISTQVDLRVSCKQVSVSVPLKVALVTDAMGGTVYAPSYTSATNGAYYIENDSKGTVWVTAVTFTKKGSITAVATAAAATGFDNIYVPFVSSGVSTNFATSKAATDINDSWSIAGAPAASINKDTGIAPLGSGTKSCINLTGGTASQLSSPKDVANIFTIEYTISAEKPAAAQAS